MKPKFKVIYKNFLGENKILITETIVDESPTRHTVAHDSEFSKAHIWINDNIVQKNNTGNDIFVVNSFAEDSDLISIFGNVL